MRPFFSRVLDVILRRSRDERLADEVQSHLDLLTDEYVSQGLSLAEARLAARKSFGGVEQMKAVYRDQRGLRIVDELTQDVRYAARLIARDRWFTAATVLALSLGIGASSTMVTLLYGMNLRGLPFHEADEAGRRHRRADALAGRTGAVRESSRRGDLRREASPASPPKSIRRSTSATTRSGTEQFGGTFLSHNTFALLRERPMLGRDFLPEDDRAGAAAVVIIGHRLWTDRYGSDPAVIGRTVRANGESATIIGVMPEGFSYPIETQVWRPLASLPAHPATGRLAASGRGSSAAWPTASPVSRRRPSWPRSCRRSRPFPTRIARGARS